MKGTVLAASFILMTALPLAAQAPSATTDLTINVSATPGVIHCLGNTLNNNILVFYDDYTYSGRHLYCREIRPNGSMGPERTITTDIDTATHWWHVTWHPYAKRYMIIYLKNGAIYARALQVDGKNASPERKVTNYSERWMRVAWTFKKKFVVFYHIAGQVAGQGLRKNAKKYKNQQILTGVRSGEALPLDAATEDDGTAVVYYANYRSGPGTMRPALVRVNHKLKILGQFFITQAYGVVSKYSRFVGNYDTTHQRHSIVWYDGGARYCTFDKAGNFVQAPTTLAGIQTINNLAYDPAANQFALFNYLYKSLGVGGADFYYTVYDHQGTVVASQILLAQENRNEIDAAGFGYARNGNHVTAWGLEYSGAHGVYARLYH